jgi:hypothetical protein
MPVEHCLYHFLAKLFTKLHYTLLMAGWTKMAKLA